ncbi:hypothetical protein ABZ897_00475 [Nonomuraea sp. NPDC046802]|uniref:hypothetical protein n=1 Tax=Nonomuraea sp. NPDC046802 TaxID=3154919 RepID=UPI0033CC7473
MSTETITLSTRELHDLLIPVLPHAGTDKTLPALGVVRLEVRESILYAVATDRFTMAVTRHRLEEPTADVSVAIGREDALAMLKLFKYDRQTDPALELVVGTVEAETILDPADRPALTISAKDGNTLVLHGREDALATWRKILGKVIHREEKPSSPHLGLGSIYLPRWTKAIRTRSPLSVSFGASPSDPVVIRADDHFIGIWMPARLEDGARALRDSLWCKEVPLEVESAEAAQAQTRGAA